MIAAITFINNENNVIIFGANHIGNISITLFKHGDKHLLYKKLSPRTATAQRMLLIP